MNNNNNSDFGWRPQSAESIHSMNSRNSMNSVEIEEGVSVDASQESSTNLSHTSDREILDSKGIWGAINGDERLQEYHHRNHGTMMRIQDEAPMEINRAQLHTSHDNASVSIVSDISSSPKRPTTPLKSLETDIEKYPAISPDSSRDSTEILLERKKTIRFSPSNKVHHFTPSPDEFVVNPDEFYITSQSCGKIARLFLVIYALPFMYGASSNITTLYLLIELTIRYEINGLIAGIFLALAYLSRVISESASRVAPKSCVFLGSLVALIGFGLLYTSHDTELQHNFGLQTNSDESDGRTLFIIGSILSNTNESQSAMQIFVRDQLLYDIKQTGQQLKRHYQMAKVARVASFMGGGFLYQYYGVKGLAILGAVMISAQIICLIIFFILDGFREFIDQNESLWGEGKPSKRFAINCSIRAALGRRRLLSSSMSKLNRTLARYYPPSIPAKILGRVLRTCIFGRTISSMIIWNVSALIMEDDFDKDYIMIGSVFAGMMVFDFMISSLSSTDNWHTLLNIKLPPPMDVYALMLGVTLSLGLVAAPNFIAFVIGLGIFVCFNGALRTVLSELQGSSQCGWESFQFQLIRRFGTAAALVSIPLLDNINHRLPLVLAIWFSFLSMIVLVVITQCHSRHEQGEDNDDQKPKDSFYISRSTRPSRRPEKNLSYAERVMLSRMIKGNNL